MIDLSGISSGRDFLFMGFVCYFCDKGITADSSDELLNKINWCHKVEIYQDRIPLQGHTIHVLMSLQMICTKN